MTKLSQTVICVFAIQLLLLFIYQRLRERGDFDYLGNDDDVIYETARIRGS